MTGRFDYMQFDEVSRRQQGFMKESFERLTHDFETLFLVGRARSLVLTKLEEAYMWVGKAIRDGVAPPTSHDLLLFRCHETHAQAVNGGPMTWRYRFSAVLKGGDTEGVQGGGLNLLLGYDAGYRAGRDYSLAVLEAS